MPDVTWFPISAKAVPTFPGLFVGWRDKGSVYLTGNRDPVAVLGPPQVGKTTGVLIPTGLCWPGSLISASTKPDFLKATRGRRLAIALDHGGDVSVFAPTDRREAIGGVRKRRWSPIQGCADARIAGIRARKLLGPNKSGKDDDRYFRDRAHTLLRAVCHAADLAEPKQSIRRIFRWMTTGELDEPQRILRYYRGKSESAIDFAHQLKGINKEPPETRGNICGFATEALDALCIDSVLANATSTDFDIDAFLASCSTLYLVSDQDDQSLVAPLIASLVEAIVSRAYFLAARQPNGRLDPPLLLLLDEVASIAPLPTLPNILTQGAGQGVLCMYATQNLDLMRATWGDQLASAIWGSTTQKLIFGAGADADLEAFSRLIGEHDEHVKTRTIGLGAGGFHVSWGSQVLRKPLLSAAEIRAIPRGKALLLASTPGGTKHLLVDTPPADQIEPFAQACRAEAEIQMQLDADAELTPSMLRDRAIAARRRVVAA